MGLENMPAGPGKKEINTPSKLRESAQSDPVRNEKVYTPSQLKAEKEYLDDLYRGLDAQSVARINDALNIAGEDPLESIVEKMRSQGEGGEDIELVSQIREFREMGATPRDIAQGIKIAHEAFVSRLSDKENASSDKYRSVGFRS
jgi:hypothetical protein